MDRGYTIFRKGIIIMAQHLLARILQPKLLSPSHLPDV